MQKYSVNDGLSDVNKKKSFCYHSCIQMIYTFFQMSFHSTRKDRKFPSAIPGDISVYPPFFDCQLEYLVNGLSIEDIAVFG